MRSAERRSRQLKFSVRGRGSYLPVTVCRAMENLGRHALIYDIKFGILDILKYFTVNPLKKLEHLALKEDAGRLLQEIIRGICSILP